ncbi:hypothetical protein [Sphingobacterium endophyticum]|uniref:hypothetical protein n=1 Tax=Sphingobacterium endophyticum TaxID=2546448 RepID=UPI0012E156E5|nr:hypothetical protein [Sphingobacterium endophyticum]
MISKIIIKIFGMFILSISSFLTSIVDHFVPVENNPNHINATSIKNEGKESSLKEIAYIEKIKGQK